MGIRIACFILMAVVTPYGWYTWVFAAGAIFLPYLAVISASVSPDAPRAAAENPERMLEAHPAAPAAPTADAPLVIRINETPRIEPPRDDRP